MCIGPKYKKLGGLIKYSTLRCVAENFAKLLKIMRNYTVELGVGKFILVFIVL